MNKKLITEDDLVAYVDMYGLYDGSVGGLVKGNRHKDGGVKVIRESEEPNMYEAVLEMEDGEYLLNAMATEKHLKRLKEINEYKRVEPEISDERISNVSNVIRLRHSMSLIILSNYPQCIINRNATAKYLEELDKMNREALEEYKLNKK